MKTHIEDIEKDDFGMEERLRQNYIYWTGREKSGCKRIVNGGNVTLGIPAAMLVSRDMCQLHEILPLISEENEQELLNINLRLCDADNFARSYCMNLRSELEAVFLAYQKGQLQIIGEWQGWRTFVEPVFFLQWAQQNGLHIQKELLPLLEANADPAKGEAIAPTEAMKSGKEHIKVKYEWYAALGTPQEQIDALRQNGITNDAIIAKVIIKKGNKRGFSENFVAKLLYPNDENDAGELRKKVQRLTAYADANFEIVFE